MKPLSKPKKIPAHPEFKPFEADDFWQVPGYRRNLPHWRLEGATYFVTFRLADSIPRSVAEKWVEDHSHWLQSLGIDPAMETEDPVGFHHALANSDASERFRYRRTKTRQFFAELDKCHGSCILSRHHQSVATALKHFHTQRIWLGDFVVMPNHVHAIVQPFPGIDLQDWLYSIKRFCSGQIQREESNVSLRSGHLWQTESFDRVIRSTSELHRTRKYIIGNPARLRPGTFALEKFSWLDEFAPL